MYYVDIPKVKGKMSEKGYNITSLAAVVGVNRNTMASYLSNPSTIPQCKLSVMASVLCDTATEATEIFFAEDFRET